jgi:zona occludens toxin (predicted ATPase)
MPYISKKKAIEMGYNNPNLQTIQIPDKYPITEAKKWLKQNGYLYRNHRATSNYNRFIQNDVIRGAEYYSKTLPNGIILTFQKF